MTRSPLCDHHCHCKSIHASEHKRTRKQVCDCARDGHAPWAENRYYHLPSPPSSSSARHEATAGGVRVSFVGWFGGVGPRCVCACRFASTTRLCLTRACFCTNRGHALPPGGLPALTQVRNQQTTSLYPIPPHPLTIHTHINPTTGGPGLPAGRVPGPPQLEGLPRRVPERCVALFVVGDCGGGSHVARLVPTSYICMCRYPRLLPPRAAAAGRPPPQHGPLEGARVRSRRMHTCPMLISKINSNNPPL